MSTTVHGDSRALCFFVEALNPSTKRRHLEGLAARELSLENCRGEGQPAKVDDSLRKTAASLSLDDELDG